MEEAGRLGFVHISDTLAFDPSELRLPDESDVEWEENFRRYSQREIDEKDK